MFPSLTLLTQSLLMFVVTALAPSVCPVLVHTGTIGTRGKELKALPANFLQDILVTH